MRMPGSPRWSIVLVRVAAQLAAAAHLLTGVVAPVLEARAEQRIGVHAEPAGTHLHTSHDEASCPSCAVRLLFGPVRGRVPTRVRPPDTAPAHRSISVHLAVALHEPVAPRPPPSPA
jgi:hypothetical protein